MENITGTDKVNVQQKSKGTKEWNKIKHGNQKINTEKRGQTTKVEARVEYIKEKRQMQREENEDKARNQKKSEMLAENEQWEDEFFGKKKGKKYKDKQREVEDFEKNIDGYVDEEIEVEKNTHHV